MVLHNYNRVLTCGAECSSLGGRKGSLFVVVFFPREGCSMPGYTLYTTASVKTGTHGVHGELTMTTGLRAG